MRKREKRRPRQIVHDDTPIETHIARVEAAVAEQGRLAFSTLFDEDMPRGRLVGIFLAVLELVRRGRLRARQDRVFDEIWLEPVVAAPAPTPVPAATPQPAPPGDPA
jgi:segregation and condensation protein A